MWTFSKIHSKHDFWFWFIWSNVTNFFYSRHLYQLFFEISKFLFCVWSFVCNCLYENKSFNSFHFVNQWTFDAVFSFFKLPHCIHCFNKNWIDYVFIFMTSFFSSFIAVIFSVTARKRWSQWCFVNQFNCDMSSHNLCNFFILICFQVLKWWHFV